MEISGGQNIPTEGRNRKYKGPEVGVCLIYSKHGNSDLSQIFQFVRRVV